MPSWARLLCDGSTTFSPVEFKCMRSMPLAPPPSLSLGYNLIVNRAAIHFDGSLPTYKKEERLGRVCETSTKAQQYFLATSAGISLNAAQRQVQNMNKDGWLPKPAFIVPAIIEALRSSEGYSQITHLALGEADPFCANDVRHNGGTILTADSDLLLYDLGPAGSVVFLQDVTVGTPAPGAIASEGAEEDRRISAFTYRQSEMCQKMSLKAGQHGLLALAFEVKQGSHRRLKSLAPPSEWRYLDPACAFEYKSFVSQYQDFSALQGTVPAFMSFLDPRVSEFILDWVESAASPVVYLPLLVDRWDQRSAWNPSTPIRQLAYSLCRGSSDTRSAVVEYRRTMSTQSRGQMVELFNEAEAPEALQNLLSYLGGFLEGVTGPARLRWITACLGLEMGHAAAEGRESITLKLWNKASKADGQLDSGDWDAVHLTAQIQGALYSLRMLHQVLKSRVGYLLASSSARSQVHQLEAFLSSLPPIAEFPCAPDMTNLFEQLHEAGTLSVLAAVTDIPEPAYSETPAGRRRKPKDRKQTREQQQSRAPPSANPFDALSIAD